MNDLLNDSPAQGNGQPDHLDSLLRRFFRAEMPHPWPDCRVFPRPAQLPPAGGQRPRQTLIRSLSRFALAAAVVLFFLAYITLSSMFPQTSKPLDTEHGPTLGSKPDGSMQLHHQKTGNREQGIGNRE